MIVALLYLQQSAAAQIAPGYSTPIPDFADPIGSTHDSSRNVVDARGTPWQTLSSDSSVSADVWSEMANASDYSPNDPGLSRFWEHRTSLYGDFAHLATHDADLPYATHVDGPVSNSASLSPSSTLQPEFNAGYRAGLVLALSRCASLVAGYSDFRNEVSDTIALSGSTGWVRAELIHPSTADVATDSLIARARNDINLRLFDLSYRGHVYGNEKSAVNWLLGVRYARLEQRLQAAYFIDGATSVDAAIDFNGIGPRLGLDGERLLDLGFLLYGEVFGGLLIGDVDAEYLQQNENAGVQATAVMNGESRVIPQLEMELGTGWQNDFGNLRLRAGYYVGIWFNSATSRSWISDVRLNDISDVDDTQLFHGMMIRAEYRF